MKNDALSEERKTGSQKRTLLFSSISSSSSTVVAFEIVS
jgi:hypothetical protein